MPTVISQNELEQLMALVADYLDETGESVTSLAMRAGVRRGQLSQLLSGNYPHAPQFEVVARVARAIGRRVDFPRNE